MGSDDAKSLPVVDSSTNGAWKQVIPKRPYGLRTGNANLPDQVSIVGLGCSSFSTFFDDHPIDMETVEASHPVVQGWIATIHYAVRDAGITLLDTAPWYGHGLSERVVGWALIDQESTTGRGVGIDRSAIILQTKVGRCNADPSQQFEFGYDAVIKSCQASLERLGTDYVDILQLHDPEFAPTLDILLRETIPAMLECQKRGYCKALGMTGYPLAVQHQIISESIRTMGRNVWDQSLTYGHLNLHTQDLLDSPLATLCNDHKIALLAAAPLSMGLLTPGGPPAWHPAGPALQSACRTAAGEDSCSIVDLALLYAFLAPSVTTTIVGLKSISQVQTVQRLVHRALVADGTGNLTTNWETVLTKPEKLTHARIEKAMALLRPEERTWDGVAEAHKFWEALGQPFERWQAAG